MKYLIYTLICIIITSSLYSQEISSDKNTFISDPKIEKKMSKFIFNAGCENFDKIMNICYKWKQTQSYKIANIVIDDSIKNASYDYYYCICVKITLIGNDDETVDTKWAFRKFSKIGKKILDIKNGKCKSLYAIKFTYASTKGVNTEKLIVDYITLEEYEKSELCYKDKNPEQLKLSDISIAMFKADMSIKSIVIKANISLSDYYNYSFYEKQNTHWSIRINVLDNKSYVSCMYGYIIKKSRVGRDIIKLVKDGKEHNVIIKISHPINESESDMVNIDAFNTIK